MKTGRDNERELNETVAALIRMVVRNEPSNYPFHPQLKPTLLKLLMEEFRDPKTGFWGARYKKGDQIIQNTDLSLTLHVASYLKGEIGEWPKTIDTFLSIKNGDFPSGWRVKGKTWNHLNMDVVELFRLGWTYATLEQKNRIQHEMQEILVYFLSTLNSESEFKVSENDESVEDAFYFGTEVLIRSGYFDRAKRFWTNRDFPNSTTVREKLISHIEKRIAASPGGAFYYKNALAHLLAPHTSSDR